MVKKIQTRIQHKHDVPSNWEKSELVPLAGELIIYEKENSSEAIRLKIGDGSTQVDSLSFYEESIKLNSNQVMHENNPLSDIINIDYATLLAFNTNELVFDVNTSPILGHAILGQLVLA